MGYSYEAYGSRRLCCDQCGQPGGVRKRKCTYKVLSDSLRGRRTWMHYCSAPAVCGPCLAKLGGNKALHAGCAEGAAASQAADDAIEAKLDAGDSLVIAGYGSWSEGVPEGMTGACYSGRAGKTWVLMPSERYKAPYPTLAEVADVTEPWVDHPGAKEVLV